MREYSFSAVTPRRHAFYRKFESLCCMLLAIKIKYYLQDGSTQVIFGAVGCMLLYYAAVSR